MSKLIKERILEKILVNDKGCWVWQGAIYKKKYSTYSQIRTSKTKTRKAHQVSYEVFVGEIPNGTELDHLCKNKLCVNPQHLEPVTHLENMKRGYWNTKNKCINGHLYRGNTYINIRGHRECKICRKLRMKKFKTKKR